MIGRILIKGHIGPSYIDEKGVLQKGVELIDVIDQVVDQKEATSFEVSIISPGGLVPVGNDIYDYLKDVDKTKPVTTIQKGLVGSIATKIFLAGRFRLVDDRYEFWIHNPFKENVTGDADQLRAEADETEKTEKEIRKFYGTFSSMGDVAIDALMKQETGLTAEQCIKYGFATGRVQAPVFNIINRNQMSTNKKDENVIDQIKSLLGLKDDKKKGVQPKNAIPNGGADTGANQSLIVNLADNAGSFYVEGDSLALGAGCFLLDAEGNPTQEPLADGPYNILDAEGNPAGQITVAGGKISAMPVDPEKDPEMPEAAEKKMNDAIAAAVKAVEEKLEKKHTDDILALKKSIKLGVQPQKAVLDGSENKITVRTIAQVQKERAEKSKTK